MDPCPAGRDELRGLSLCAGAGGLDLGLHVADPGYRTVCYVERDSFAAAVLVARMADAALCEAPVWDDLSTFDGRPWRGVVDLVSAGYPCQPFSSAGRRLGADDPRHLWPHVRRVLEEAEPEWVFIENVQGHLDLGFDVVAGELQGLGYRLQAGVFSGYEVGASHERRRLFCLGRRHLADANGADLRDPIGPAGGSEGPDRLSGGRSGRQPDLHCDGGAEPVGALALPSGGRLGADDDAADIPLFAPGPFDGRAWHEVLARRPDLEPAVPRLGDGLAYRMERSFVAGNGVVPLAAALAYRTPRAGFEGG
ncbi:DNA cytosine methyltransferase [Prosthecomicrobium hirschii]|uniref:DNA cytosine methyltransferase n=1 Tax=Prosthecodimorpha hirschii TaxID=665126 RepID=UPI00221E7614|nr:DNA cytosine methyltransferase [Prosthecomicrobium hirschii]